jgi:hypothetical protein
MMIIKGFILALMRCGCFSRVVLELHLSHPPAFELARQTLLEILPERGIKLEGHDLMTLVFFEGGGGDIVQRHLLLEQAKHSGMHAWANKDFSRLLVAVRVDSHLGHQAGLALPDHEKLLVFQAQVCAVKHLIVCEACHGGA